MIIILQKNSKLVLIKYILGIHQLNLNDNAL